LYWYENPLRLRKEGGPSLYTYFEKKEDLSGKRAWKKELLVRYDEKGRGERRVTVQSKNRTVGGWVRSRPRHKKGGIERIK